LLLAYKKERERGAQSRRRGRYLEEEEENNKI
jgi:hypothetical protein